MAVTEKKTKLPDLSGKFRVTVGIHVAEGGVAKSDAPGQTVLEVASFHEFGLGVPQRSFVRSWFDESQGDIAKALQRAAEAGTKPGGTERALKQTALLFEAQIKQRIIRKQIPPPNAASTIAIKGSSTPLVDTGQLLSAIRGKVERVG